MIVNFFMIFGFLYVFLVYPIKTLLIYSATILLVSIILAFCIGKLTKLKLDIFLEKYININCFIFFIILIFMFFLKNVEFSFYTNSFFTEFIKPAIYFVSIVLPINLLVNALIYTFISMFEEEEIE
ncbi:MAG: hypothetical protein R3Y13_05255 [bacterium]